MWWVDVSLELAGDFELVMAGGVTGVSICTGETPEDVWSPSLSSLSENSNWELDC